MTKNSQIDKEEYGSAKQYLKEASEHLLAAGRDIGELSEFALQKFGNTFIPYLHQFSSDVRDGRITIKGLSESAKVVILGHHISAEERDAMIRAAAYLRAEQRGFTGGSPQEDWLLAEQEVDQQLAREAGLVTKGSKAINSASIIFEKEMGNVKDVVSHWLKEKTGKKEIPKAKKKVVAKKHPTKKKASAKKNNIVKTDDKKEKESKSKKKVKKKTAKKSVSTKKKAGKKKAK